MSNKGRLFVLSAPSGTGKTTLCRALLKLLPNLQYSISATTREKRPGEVEGKDYFFLTEEDFKAKKEKGEFLESANVFGCWYGTPKSFIEEKLESGQDILLDIDVQGAASIREKKVKGIFIFLIPPSMEALKERLLNRKTDAEKVIENRLAKAREEIGYYKQYDYVIVNDVLEESLQRIKSIILAEKSHIPDHKGVIDQLLSDK